MHYVCTYSRTRFLIIILCFKHSYIFFSTYINDLELLLNAFIFYRNKNNIWKWNLTNFIFLSLHLQKRAEEFHLLQKERILSVIYLFLFIFFLKKEKINFTGENWFQLQTQLSQLIFAFLFLIPFMKAFLWCTKIFLFHFENWTN